MYVLCMYFVCGNSSKHIQQSILYSNVLNYFTNAILFVLSFVLSNVFAVLIYVILLSFRLCYICMCFLPVFYTLISKSSFCPN